MMKKKMKGVVAMEVGPHVYEDPRARFWHQSLMQDYQDLQKMKEVVAMEAAPHECKDPRSKFGHESLMQDYQDLQEGQILHQSLMQDYQDLQKMKGVVAMDAAPHVCKDPRSKFGHESLMQDYQDLQEVGMVGEVITSTRIHFPV